MKKSLLVVLSLVLFQFSLLAKNPARPDEGMWLPMLVERLNHTDMQKYGLRLSAKELYDINHSSLKDGIVSMGFFCTGEIVSDKGMFLTNHHCGYETIQQHSTTNHDYLTDGFWAQQLSDELPVEGVTAYILNYMADVTAEVLDSVNDKTTEADRQIIVRRRIAALQAKYNPDNIYHLDIKSFFNGNEYYMFVYHQFGDVRLVAAPPESIGKFGGDTDNWMWPRHTGDFSMFRIYTAADGSNAPFHKDNVPYKPKHVIPVSLKGVQKDDYAMIWGYPGTTDRYLSSYGIKEALEITNQSIVDIRDKKLKTMKMHMDTDPAVRIQYAAKYAQTANYWKYFIGQTKGLKNNKVLDKKLALEQQYLQWAAADNQRFEKYGNALKLIEQGYEKNKPYALPLTYLEEAIFQGPEQIYYGFSFFNIYMMLQQYQSADKATKAELWKEIEAEAANLQAESTAHFKDINASTDQDLFVALLGMYFENVAHDYTAYSLDKKENKKYIIDQINKKYKGKIENYAQVIYSKSILTDPSRLKAFLDKPNYKSLAADPGFELTLAMVNSIREVYGAMEENDLMLDEGRRLFVDGLRQMMPEKKFYPNANSTLRMTYGQVKDYAPADAVEYNYFTTLDGLMAKEDANNPEFVVPAKLKELYKNKDFGPYADKDGTMHTCFLTTNDITGGNSGSPVMDAQGNLIGIAFDGNWEAMSGDIFYEQNIQRTINVDIRYVLFIIDKLGNSKHLIDEMVLVQ
jgi:hypothetical protein